MNEPIATLLIPGLLATSRLYAEQMPALWRLGPVMVANHTRDDTLAAIARRILESAPPRFALVGLSMGGYLSFEILRQAPGRVTKLALLDTTARPDTPEQSQRRRDQIASTSAGRFEEVVSSFVPLLVHPRRVDDAHVRAVLHEMAQEVGAEAFIRQQMAIMGRPDSRPLLGAIRCPSLVLVGDGDQLTPPDRAAEMAAGIPGARFVTVPDCGHASTVERPEYVTRTLVEFLGDG